MALDRFQSTSPPTKLAAYQPKPWPQAIGADSINACCLPGGIVFVHSGLIRAVGGSKQALSFVVGHEVRPVG